MKNCIFPFIVLFEILMKIFIYFHFLICCDRKGKKVISDRLVRLVFSYFPGIAMKKSKFFNQSEILLKEQTF